MKTCRKCNRQKELKKFYKNHTTTKDGYQSYCINCKKKYARKYYYTEPGRKTRIKGRERYNQSDKGKATMKRYTRMNYKKHPEIYRAKSAVKHAVNAGKLPFIKTLKCHYCPKQAEDYHHYKGYKPENHLDVLPVCKKCHKKAHRNMAA